MIACHHQLQAIGLPEKKHDTDVSRDSKFEHISAEMPQAEPSVTVGPAKHLDEFGETLTDFFQFAMGAVFSPTSPTRAKFNHEGLWQCHPTSSFFHVSPGG
jgi:hypothetical protein